MQQEGCKPGGRRRDLRRPFCLWFFGATPQQCLFTWKGLCFPVATTESSFHLFQHLQGQCHCSPTITSQPTPPSQRAGSWSRGTTPVRFKVLVIPPSCLCLPSPKSGSRLLCDILAQSYKSSLLTLMQLTVLHI